MKRLATAKCVSYLYRLPIISLPNLGKLEKDTQQTICRSVLQLPPAFPGLHVRLVHADEIGKFLLTYPQRQSIVADFLG